MGFLSRSKKLPRRGRGDAPPVISASDLASWSYCSESWRLARLQGHEPTNSAQRREGEIRHENWHATFSFTRILIWLGLGLMAAGMIAMLTGGGG